MERVEINGELVAKGWYDASFDSPWDHFSDTDAVKELLDTVVREFTKADMRGERGDTLTVEHKTEVWDGEKRVLWGKLGKQVFTRDGAGYVSQDGIRVTAIFQEEYNVY